MLRIFKIKCLLKIMDLTLNSTEIAILSYVVNYRWNTITMSGKDMIDEANRMEEKGLLRNTNTSGEIKYEITKLGREAYLKHISQIALQTA